VPLCDEEHFVADLALPHDNVAWGIVLELEAGDEGGDELGRLALEERDLFEGCSVQVHDHLRRRGRGVRGMCEREDQIRTFGSEDRDP
jgi:hypothetical protein